MTTEPDGGHDPLGAVKPGPVTRYRDVAHAVAGAWPNQLAKRYYERLAVDLAAQRESERRAVATLPQWHAERERFRAAMVDSLGPLDPPPEVQAEVTRVIERPGVLVRNLIFAMPHGDRVTANVYLPRHASAPAPAVIGANGHSVGGKVGYAQRGVWLASRGFVALSFDLIGQGERRFSSPAGVDYPASTQHDIIGHRLILGGMSLATLMIRETMAAVTLLRAMPEVDGSRIGITGGSGGGWLSGHAAAADPRIAAVAPAAAGRSFRHTPQADDAEQVIFDMQRRGLDFPDLLGLAICPRPVLILANDRDIWPIESTHYVHDEARRFYEMHGAADRLAMKVWSRGHAYEDDQFAEAVTWFERWLKPEPPSRPFAPGDNAIDPAELNACSASGVYGGATLSPARVIRDMIGDRSRGPRGPAGWVTRLAESLAPRINQNTPWKELSRADLGDCIGRRLCFVPEAGVVLPAEVIEPPRELGVRGVTIVIDPLDRRERLDESLELARTGQLVLRPDLRGWGETSPEESWADWESFPLSHHSGRHSRLHALALMCGRNLPVDRAGDAVALIGVAARLAPAAPVSLHGRGGGAWVALLAAVADPRVLQIKLDHYPATVADALAHEIPLLHPENFIHGFLSEGLDVEDLIQMLRARHVRVGLTRPLDALLRPLNSDPIQSG